MELTKENGLHRKGEPLPDYPSRIRISLKSIDYDAIYNIKNKPLIIFKEFSSILDHLEDKIYTIRKKVWNFGEIPILIIVLQNEIRIYNGFMFDKEKNEIWKKISVKSQEINEFSFMNLYSGRFWKKYELEFNKETRVYDILLRNLNDARKQLYNGGLPFTIIHNLIGRLIFSRYLIDRNALPRSFFRDNYKSDFEEIIRDKEKLYDYFEYLKVKFNGDMFPEVENERDCVEPHHLNTLYKLLSGYDVITGQTRLFEIYDFSIIPVELISNIYEKFLDKDNVDSNKSYYTPLFLVDYILSQTLDEVLESKENSGCKILDPACGSGVFLVESLRRLIEKKEASKGRNLTDIELKRIVLDNIFGVDKDEDAIHLSIFSIYITMLDYQKPKDIEKFRFPVLKNINLFVSDVFDWKNEFNSKIKNMDIIVGNPPWGKTDGLHLEYCSRKGVPISYKQIAQSFLVRVKDFAKPNTRIALIVTSKVLYNLRTKDFRKYFLKHFTINRILEFSSIRRKVFKNAIGPGVIIFYDFTNTQERGKNAIEHISLKPNRFFDLFRTIVIEKFDMKSIQQKYFMEYDWLWKVILYGNILDFHFIGRLKEDYNNINDVIRENALSRGVGLKPHGPGESKDALHLVGKPFLDVKRLQRYYVNDKTPKKWSCEKLHRIPNLELFKPPYILLKKGVNSDFQAISAFSNQEWVFRDCITAIKGKPSDVKILKNLLGLLNSKLFTYFIFSTGSSTGIEREQVHIEEKFAFPVVIDDAIYQQVDQLHRLHNQFNESTGITSLKKIKDEMNNIKDKLDEIIFKLYQLDSIEKDLVDYVVEISIPLFKGKNEPFEPLDKNKLMDYAEIFVDHFGRRFNGPRDYFCAEIIKTDYFIAMNFKIIPHKPKIPIVFLKDDDIKGIVKSLGDLSIEEIKDDLYIQKDVKGFEKTSFFVIKPNEYKNWHRAIARLDLSEFIDAIIKSDLKGGVY